MAENAELVDVPKGKAQADGAVHQELVKDLYSKSETNLPVSGAGTAKSDAALNVSQELLKHGIMPALERTDIPSTMVDAAKALAGKNLGLPSDHNMSSGTSVSRLLQAAGTDITATPLIPNLVDKLGKLGWESMDLTDKSELRKGDLVFTSMDPGGRNVGIVGENGIIFSHNYRTQKFEGKTNWSSKWVTVMRQKDK